MKYSNSRNSLNQNPNRASFEHQTFRNSDSGYNLYTLKQQQQQQQQQTVDKMNNFIYERQNALLNKAGSSNSNFIDKINMIANTKLDYTTTNGNRVRNENYRVLNRISIDNINRKSQLGFDLLLINLPLLQLYLFSCFLLINLSFSLSLPFCINKLFFIFIRK